MSALASICGAWGGGPVATMIATGAIMTLVMMAPCAIVDAGRVRGHRAAFVFGYAAVMLVVGAAGAGLELLLAEARMLDVPVLRVTLSVTAAVLLMMQLNHRADLFHGGLRSGASHAGHQLPLCLAMIATQLALGPMDLTLMVALSLWMLAYATRPVSRRSSPATQSRGRGTMRSMVEGAAPRAVPAAAPSTA